MTLHISETYCGADRRWRVSLLTMVRFARIVAVFMVLFGCRDCASELRDALRNARRIS